MCGVPPQLSSTVDASAKATVRAHCARKESGPVSLKRSEPKGPPTLSPTGLRFWKKTAGVGDSNKVTGKLW